MAMLVSDFVTKTKAAIAEITNVDISTSTVDINNCDREPIHTPGAIQPHGVLIALSAADWTITHVSANTADYLRQSPQDLLGNPIQSLLTQAQIENINSCLNGDFDAINPLHFDLSVAGETRAFNAIVHRNDDVIFIELEPVTRDNKDQSAVTFFDFHRLVKRPVGKFQQTTSVGGLCQAAVEELQNITGFDRVMAYRFDEDGSGEIIAEVKPPEMTPYLGLRYPSTDVPKQAIYLYLLNLLRIIPDVGYKPVPVLAYRPIDESDTPVEPAPLDMSLSMLRSVSPLHTEYLSNMGVRASMCISLVKNNQLWGMIVCHHTAPRQISYEYRTICEFLAQAITLELADKEKNENADYRLKIKQLQTEFVDALTQSQTLKEGLTQKPKRLFGLAGATGAAFCEKGEITLLGETPSPADTASLVQWLSEQFTDSTLYHTAALGADYPPAAQFAGHTSGLLAVSISKAQDLYVLWFRTEVIQTVNWAGNPEKSIELDEQGQEVMSPRRSFEKWKQTIQHQALPWRPCEIEAAVELRRSVIGLVLQRADELAELNSELERSNTELDSFAYIASHDLKEPLRGIHNYSSFLIEDYGEVLGEDGNKKLQTLMRLTHRMENLISSLLHYSRLGRAELIIAPVNLSEVVDGVLELMEVSKPEEATIEVVRPLPVLACDRTQITELFTNLVTNAIKYNNKDQKQVRIGYYTAEEAQQQNIRPVIAAPTADTAPLVPTTPVFYVQDNGIGIQEKHSDTVFRIFKRLHGPNKFGGGTGAGLTITKKIVEKHGGNIWVASTYGKGTTFYFTLEEPQEQPENSPKNL